MNIILFDDEARTGLLPLTFTKPVSELRLGILTIREKWQKFIKGDVSWSTQDYLQSKYPLVIKTENLFINGSVSPNAELVSAIEKLESGQSIRQAEVLIAFKAKAVSAELFHKERIYKEESGIEFKGNLVRLRQCWDLFSKNEQAISDDFHLITKGRKSQPVSSSNQTINPENIFLEEGAKVECAVLNASTGFIYLDKNSEVMEGAMIRGPFSLGEASQLKMGAKIYGATTIGPHCKVGGEVNNSVISGYSNKAHDGFLGNSVIGEWCNLGADSNNSNLKNNYSTVKVWSFEEENYVSSGLQFCGLIMGDHSKCSINTMFNTGTVVGVSANIFGNGFPQKYIPSFSWGGSEGFNTYRLEEAMDVAQRVFERRKLEFGAADQEIFKHLFDLTTIHRAW
ncbi:MAG TPA: GlmU family protein [Bacteroidia bacterium]|nr:GlmU family protein [Bacteroidia bacterium]HNS11269.1 GlmU family protein [Bacteroidia bacterium]